jgi:UDP-glucose 4-epimerase
VAAALVKILTGQPVDIWGDGSVVRDYIYIDDVAEALIRAATYDTEHSIFNIGSGVGLSVIEVVEQTAAALGIANPKMTFKLGRKADVPVNVLDISRAKQELDWAPRTDWRDAILRTVDWMKTQPSVRALLG